MNYIESETVELKSEVVSDICKEIIAFANTKDGTLYIGVQKEPDGDTFEDRRSLEQNLTFEAAAEQFARRKVAFDETKMRTLGLLSSDGIYSNVAILLSERCSSTVKAATFSGIEKVNFHDRREFTGSLFRRMEDIYAYLDLRNSTSSTIEGLYRTDLRDYPEDALREALLNALVHRDYSFSASTLISVYDDRLEFVSIGGLPSGIELDDVMLGISVCRNPKLASVFYRLELIEAYGTGMPKIMSSYVDSGLKPKIEITNNAFKIMRPNRNAVDKKVTAASIARNSNEKRIMEYVKANGFLVRSEVDAMLSVSQSTSSRILKRMVANGLLYQEGVGKKTKFRKR